MFSRKDISRAIRNLRDGPRAPAGPERRVVTMRTLDSLQVLDRGVGGRLKLEDDRASGGGELWLASLDGAIYLPRSGAVIDRQGGLYRPTIAEALEYDPQLSSFAYLRLREGQAMLRPPASMPILDGASVWMPFHATYNYGHFVLDALSSLLALEEAGLTGRWPPIAPPLKRWQAELLHLAFGERLLVRQISSHAVVLRQAAFASSMDNFLHAPTPIVGRLRQRILEGAPRPTGVGPKRIYLSRRGYSMRVMLNEAELEAALARRGFTIAHPERMTVAEQVNMARDAEIIVAPTGAGLTNALFAPPEARVIEIQPVSFGGAWVRQFRRVVGGEVTLFEVPEPVPRAQVPFRHRRRLGFHFAYVADLDALLPVVDAAF